jgi:hypothetical protein
MPSIDDLGCLEEGPKHALYLDNLWVTSPFTVQQSCFPQKLIGADSPPSTTNRFQLLQFFSLPQLLKRIVNPPQSSF